MSNEYLIYVQVLYAFLIPAQIFAALMIERKAYKNATALIIAIMIMEAIGIQYWILAQTEAIK